MQVAIKGLKRLERVQKKLRDMPAKVIPAAEAAALNKAATVVSKAVRRRVKAQSGLPARPMGKRLKSFRADARKPVRRAKVWLGGRIFSASYQNKSKSGFSGLMAMETGGGVKLGKRIFPNSEIRFSKKYGRHYVAKKGTGGKHGKPIYPHVRLDKMHAQAMRHAETKGAKFQERAMKSEMDKRTAKYMKRI